MIRQSSIFFIQKHTRHSFEQNLIGFLELVRAQQENTVALIHPSFGAQAHNLAVDGIVQIKGVTGILVIQDYQVDFNMPVAPVGMGLQGFNQQG